MYTPRLSSAKTQKTCSKECRDERRARQARERYALDREACQNAARERQRKHRAQRTAPSGSGPPRASVPAAVVQYIATRMASLPATGWLSRERVAIELRKVARVAADGGMSRAGLRADSPSLAGS